MNLEHVPDGVILLGHALRLMLTAPEIQRSKIAKLSWQNLRPLFSGNFMATLPSCRLNSTSIHMSNGQSCELILISYIKIGSLIHRNIIGINDNENHQHSLNIAIMVNSQYTSGELLCVVLRGSFVICRQPVQTTCRIIATFAHFLDLKLCGSIPEILFRSNLLGSSPSLLTVTHSLAWCARNS